MAINGLAVLAFLAVSYGYLQIKLRADLEGELRHELEARARLCQAVLATGDANMQQAVRRASEMAGARVSLIARDGRVLADSQVLAENMSSQLSRPEVEQALKNGVGSTRRKPD